MRSFESEVSGHREGPQCRSRYVMGLARRDSIALEFFEQTRYQRRAMSDVASAERQTITAVREPPPPGSGSDQKRQFASSSFDDAMCGGVFQVFHHYAIEGRDLCSWDRMGVHTGNEIQRGTASESLEQSAMKGG